MPHSIEQTLPLSRYWRSLCDALSLGRPGPPLRIQRRLLLCDIVAARAIAWPCPSWQAVFVKAFAHVSAANPQLRRSFLSWPWPRIYQHAETIAALPVRRDAATSFVYLKRPESMRLAEIDEALISSTCSSRNGGLAENVSAAWSGRFRASRFGTMSLTTASLHSPSILVPTLHHGRVSANGEVDVCLSCDPRIVDAGDAASILTALEDSLHERIMTELRYLESVEAA